LSTAIRVSTAVPAAVGSPALLDEPGEGRELFTSPMDTMGPCTQLPTPNENSPVVHVTTESLIKGWQRVGTARRESWQRFRPMH